MSKLYLLSITLLLPFFLAAQQTANCSEATSNAVLNINNIKAHLANGGDFWRPEELGQSSGYFVGTNASGNEVATIFDGGLWLGAVDGVDGNLKVAASTYRQTGLDFWPGPVNEATSTTDSLQCNTFDRHWKINKTTIDKFIAGEALSDEEKAAIYDWPGRGNPTNAYGNLDQDLAPFVDVDSDGIYNPDNGDYPNIKGDQAVWWVINDVGNLHTESNSEAMGLEIKKMAYAYANEPELENSTFLEITITNKSDKNYLNFIFGFWVDVDLGDYNDDFVGCDTLNALGYVYNGDKNDGTNQGFGEIIPMQGIQLLNVPQDYYRNENDMYTFVTYSNDFTNFGNPENAEDFYGYLNAEWKDESPITKGDNGRSANNPVTKYMYPGNPTDKESWTECSSSNEPGDRRFLMTSGLYSLKSGEIKTWTIAAHTIPEIGSDCPDVQPLIDKAKFTKNFFQNEVISNVESHLPTQIIALHPNPAKDKLYFNNLTSIANIEVLSIDGKTILQKNILQNKSYLNVSNLKKGLYYLKFIDKENVSSVSKFIKQ